MALAHQLVAELRADAEQHLELVLVRRHSPFLDQRQRLADHPVVVCRNGHVATGFEERSHSLDEVHTNGLELLVGDLGRLDVDPLADADVGLQIREVGYVRQRPLHVRLEDDPDVVELLPAQLAVELERLGRGRGVLHVDADEVVALGGLPDELGDVVPTELVIEVQAEPRELDADVGVETLALDRLEDVLVLGEEGACLVAARDFLAEHVDRRHLSLLVEPADGAARLGERRAGDVAAGELLDHRPGNGR